MLIKRPLLGKIASDGEDGKKVALENDFGNLLPRHLIKSEIRVRR